MADNIPSVPGGPVPPKPPEAAKVQPKKETVRISLPPKPSAAPTIKLPSVPTASPGAAPAVGAPVAPASPAAGAPSPLRPTSTPPATGAPPSARPPTSTGPAAARPPAPTTLPRPAAPVAKRISGLDFGLAITAAVVCLVAVVMVSLLLQMK